MNFDRNLHKNNSDNRTKNPSKLLMKLLLGIIAVFLVLYAMNNIVKTEVSTLIENKNNIEKDKSMPQNAN